jgi:hypothetical protein
VAFLFLQFFIGVHFAAHYCGWPIDRYYHLMARHFFVVEMHAGFFPHLHYGYDVKMIVLAVAL